MNWTAVSSWSCFCWLYKSFSTFGCKEYNQSDFGIDHLVMSTGRVFSCVVGGGCLLWPVHSLGETLISFCLSSSSTPRPDLPVTPGVSWLPTFAFQSPIMKKTSFWVLVLKGLVGHQFNFSLFSITGQGIDLDYCATEWFALEMNRHHSVTFGIFMNISCFIYPFINWQSFEIFILLGYCK